MHLRHRHTARLLVLVSALTVGTAGALVGAEPPPEAPVGSAVAVARGVTLPLVVSRYEAPLVLQDRFGVGASAHYGIDAFSLARLGGSWYWDWAARPDAPGEPGVDYYPNIRLEPVMVNGERTGDFQFSPDEATIAATAAAHPGATWLVGNEPDCDLQDNLRPSVYARAYGYLYGLVKSLDPFALVAAGQIVQPTPLRLRYLDVVLDEYRTLYGHDMPVDVWAIHAYPLREDPEAWGAGLPPGIQAGPDYPPLLIELDQTADITLFTEFVRDFRSWMAIRGYRECPLIVTEFGVLMPPNADWGTDLPGVLLYMEQAFAFLLEARDTGTGLPHDDNRLVQRWAWFKLVRPVNADPWSEVLAGDLYDGATGARLPAGDRYAAYTAQLPRRVNLRVVDVAAQVPVPAAPGESVDVTLTARMVNNGTVRTPGPVRVRFYLGDPAGGTQLGPDRLLPALGGHGIPRAATVTWYDAPPGTYAVFAVVDPLGEVAETDEGDNTASATVSVG